MIQEELGLSSAAAGIITTLPLVAFAVMSPFAGKIGIKIGAGKAMLLGLAAIGAGVAIRSYFGAFGLFAGTVVIGLGIAFGNVLIPAVIKSEYPEKVGTVTGIFTTAMVIFAGISSGISVPLAKNTGLGWKKSLLVWLILAAVTIAIWLKQFGLKF